MDCSLSLRRSPRSSRPMFQAAVQVEMLESRMCPAGGKGAPVLAYTVSNPGDPTVTISGQVTGTYAANSTVAFTGAVTNTVTTAANGTFSFTVAANYLGTVTGLAWDNHGTQSNVLLRSVTSQPPQFVSFSVSVDGDAWTFTGHIWNENLFNQTITFSGLDGLNGQSVTTDSAGDFTVTYALGAGATGTVTATVADCWALTGTAQLTI